MRTMSTAVSLPYYYSKNYSRLPCCGIPSVMLSILVSSKSPPGSYIHVPDNEGNFCGKSLFNALCCKWRTASMSIYACNRRQVRAFIRNEDGRCSSSGLLDGVLYRCEHRLAEMLRTCLLWVRATDDISACITCQWSSLPLSREVFDAAHTVLDSLLRMETIPLSAHSSPSLSFIDCHSRSLFSSEALEDHLGVAVDAEVLDGFGVWRRARRIALPRRGFAERGAQRSSESLHRDNEAVTKADVGSGKRMR